MQAKSARGLSLFVAFLPLLLLNSPASAKKALLVGIEQYESSVIKVLNGPEQDVHNMERFVTTHWGYEASGIRKLINEAATKDNILKNIQEWLVVGNEDELLFYFSGHGFHRQDDSGDEQDGLDETIVPYDVVVQDNVVSNMIADDDFSNIVKQVGDRKVVFIFDSCYSGTVTRSFVPASDLDAAKKYSKTLDNLGVLSQQVTVLSRSLLDAHRREKSFVEQFKGAVVWTAASSSQKAFTDFEQGSGSIFTNRFIAGAGEMRADHNGDGRVTYAELIGYLRRESEEFCARNRDKCSLGLTPTLEAVPELFAHALTGAREESGKLDMADYVDATLPVDNARQVSVKIRQGNELRLGDMITIEVESEKSGYLIVLDINSKGEMVQLFPNRYSSESGADNYIAASGRVSIPSDNWGFSLQAGEPLGKGLIVAIVAEDNLGMSDLLDSHKDLQVVNAPLSYLDQLSSRFNTVWVGDEVNRPVHWAKAKVEYVITR